MIRNYSMYFFLCVLFVCAISYGKTNNDDYISKSRPQQGIVLATWNIGHYSNGKKSYSLIGPDQYNEKQRRYKSVIYDSISADIIGINEYSSVFGEDRDGKKGLSSQVLFNKYSYKNEDDKSWICNSIFSNIKVDNVERSLFESSKPFIAKTKKAAIYNYLTADIIIDGEKVKMVYVHLINRESKILKLQINELIFKFRQLKKIVIFGDFNTWNMKAFKKAGYKLANDGSLITFPSKSIAIDNILVKGLIIRDVRVVKTDLSDHYPLICKITAR